MKKKRSWAWIIVVLIIVAAVAGAIVLQNMLRTDAAGLSAQQYEAAKVTKGDINVTVHGTGTIEAMDTSAVTANASAKVESVLVENGDAVKKGQLIAKLSADDVNDRISSLKDQISTQDATIAGMRSAPGTKTLYAPVDARVKAIYAKEDEDAGVSMSAHGALMLLSTDGKMKVGFVPAKGAKLKAGDAVKIVRGGKAVDGYITSVPDSTTDKAEAVVNNDSYPVNANVEVKTAKGALLGKGQMEVNRPLLVTVSSGTVDRLYVEVNDTVSRGHRLVRLTGYILDPNFDSQISQRQKLQDDLNQAVSDLKDLNVYSPADGIVTDLALQENAMAQDGMSVCTIQQTASFKLVVAVDELDIPGIVVGQKAEVKIDALPNEAASGEVTKISSIGNVSNDVTTYDVTLKVNAPAGTLTNMSASADIQVASKSGVLLVPVEALHTVDGKTYVYGALPGDRKSGATSAPAAQGGGMFGRFINGMPGGSGGAGNAKEQRKSIEVSVGLVSDTSAEILSGLKEGDEIAVPVAQNSNNMFNFGGGGQNRNDDGGEGGQPAATGGSAKS